MEKNSKIYVAGHNGLAGSAIVRNLKMKGYYNIVTRTRGELDLMNQAAVSEFFSKEKPEIVFLAAAKVGGILANNEYRADFIYHNLMIELNVINSAHTHGVQRLMFLGSNCIYPKECPQPIKEDYLLTGPLEFTNEPYAIAKISGIKLCESYNRQYKRKYISVMPVNLYGPNDHYDLMSNHVLPALIKKAHNAKIKNETYFEVWGTGTPRREFMFIDDLADACVYLMSIGCNEELINIGTGADITIKELAYIIRDVVGFKGDIRFDDTKPDGTMRKLLDATKLTHLNWKPKISLNDGLRMTYESTSFYQNEYGI
jgi:GDP-L-fucose synthase